MAKKKEEQLAALQMPLPSGSKASTTVKVDLTGLNLRQTADSGELSMEKNISTAETPYIVPSQKRVTYKSYEGAEPIGLFGFEDFFVYIYAKGGKILIDYIRYKKTVLTAVLQDSDTLDGLGTSVPRQIVKFNVYEPSDNTKVAGKYVYKLLIFPDKKSMDFYPDVLDKTVNGNHSFNIFSMTEDIETKTYYNDVEPYEPPADAEFDTKRRYFNTYNNLCFRWQKGNEEDNLSRWVKCVVYGFPNLKYVTVHLSRLFGVDDDNVYASGFNDYTNWDLDTAEEYSDAHAWQSAAQSNTKANGAFTGIYTYQNHVVLFKDDFIHELTNTKNPFRINDVFAEGTFDVRTIQEVDGKLIFVSRDGVKMYTGGNPKIIGYKLNVLRFQEAISGTDGRRYYLFCKIDNDERRLFVYDTYFDRWAEEESDKDVIAFAHNDLGMFMLTNDGNILKMDTGGYGQWAFETELLLGESVDIKHLRKLQVLADIPEGSKMKIYALYNGEEFGENSHLLYNSEENKTSLRVSRNKSGDFIPIRIRPRRTANFGFKLHFEGEGYVRIRQIEMKISAGGELYI